ncbi:DUF413 domain-containing protein [Balneatrix alpica]|uniref:Macrodomain Ori protein n=1 Tax=Balneatrix alpica TaxID=75684 RepID=A0ABV5ZEV9_9GAMM|nr:DUF413 domain-containing protein [Balneatrix alpica]
MSKDRQYYLKKPYFDDENYPYGLAGSGDFSIKETKLITQYGTLFRALMDGLLPPVDPDDHQLMSVVKGEAPADNDMHRAWVKYLKKINDDTYVPSMSLSSVREGEDTDFSEGGSDYDDD